MNTRAIMLLALLSSVAQAQTAEEAAKAFGAREAISAVALSPDGTKISFIGPGMGRESILYTVDTVPGALPKVVFKTSGSPETLSWCRWISSERLACRLGGLQQVADEIYGFSTMLAVNRDGSGVTVLSKRQGQNALYASFGGGSIIDYLPGEDGAVLMMRRYVPEARIGSTIAKNDEGNGVDRVDTVTGKSRQVESPRPDAIEFITDGHGLVRIMGMRTKTPSGYSDSEIKYSYRNGPDDNWKPLSTFDYLDNDGFSPYAVDSSANVVYGFRKIDGRKSLVTISLDGAKFETVLTKRPDVDVDGLIQIGRHQRVVGASYATETRQSVYFDPDLKKLAASLRKALPGQPVIEFIDASADENKLLLWAEGDTAPGTYYLYDKSMKKLQPVMAGRPQLSRYTLAQVRPITFPARDGTQIPSYLILPAGSSGQNLPAIVTPHAGHFRDEWGFDWLAQFYASQGFAVIQPNFRGSIGYGDAWFQKNGFQSWRSAISDVADAGRWLIKQGIADPQGLTIMGWSYGGYAALQTAATEPDLFKRVVAVAPVTDLAELKRESRNFLNHRVDEKFIGNGPHIIEGSPAQNAKAITAPVMLFHGDLDADVRIRESRLMAAKLKDAGKPVELIEYSGMDHRLADSTVRADILKKSAAFLKGN